MDIFYLLIRKIGDVEGDRNYAIDVTDQPKNGIRIDPAPKHRFHSLREIFEQIRKVDPQHQSDLDQAAASHIVNSLGWTYKHLINERIAQGLGFDGILYCEVF